VIASILALFASADPAPGAPSAPASMPGAKEIASFGIGEPEAGELAQQAYLKASNTDAYDHFGITIALSGDTLAVGACDEESVSMWGDEVQADNGTESSGAVYVFVRNGIGWRQQAFLKASNADSRDSFGTRVALSGDTLAVGAPCEDSDARGVNGDQDGYGEASSGAVYIFVRSGSTWVQQAYIKASNTDGLDDFGYSLALSGDTLVVGAYGEDSSANGNQEDNGTENSGAVYVFVRNGSKWSQQAFLKASNTGVNDFFGSSVSLSGDTLAVGAYGEASSARGVNGDQADNTAVSSGAAYVFIRKGASWSQEAYLKASNADSGDYFGASVALSGDTLVVGARNEASGAAGVDGNQEDNTAPYSGAAYVFVRNGSVWSQQAYLKASNATKFDGFGDSLALSGDTLVVGAPYERVDSTGVNGSQAEISGLQSGAAYVFIRNGSDWNQHAYLKASNTGVNDRFGYSLALSGDTVAVGADCEASAAMGVNGDQLDNSADKSGAVYVFR